METKFYVILGGPKYRMRRGGLRKVGWEIIAYGPFASEKDAVIWNNVHGSPGGIIQPNVSPTAVNRFIEVKL